MRGRSGPSNLFFDNLENWPGNFVVAQAGERRDGSTAHHMGRMRIQGCNFLYANDFPGAVADSTVRMAASVTLPANAFLHFAHAYGFEFRNFDGGVVEYSINTGTTWVDAGPLIDANGYTGTLDHRLRQSAGRPGGVRQRQPRLHLEPGQSVVARGTERPLPLADGARHLRLQLGMVA